MSKTLCPGLLCLEAHHHLKRDMIQSWGLEVKRGGNVKWQDRGGLHRLVSCAGTKLLTLEVLLRFFVFSVHDMTRAQGSGRHPRTMVETADESVDQMSTPCRSPPR